MVVSQSTGKDPRTVKYATKAGVFHGSYTETTKALRDFIDEIERGKIQRLGLWWESWTKTATRRCP